MFTNYCSSSFDGANIFIKHHNNKIISIPALNVEISKFIEDCNIASSSEKNIFNNKYILCADKFETNLDPNNIDNIKEIISTKMNFNNVLFKLNNIILYGKDGFSNEHQFIPENANTIGELIISLPLFHSTKETFTYNCVPFNNNINWYALNNYDKYKQILPITDGYCMLMTFQINKIDVVKLININLNLNLNQEIQTFYQQYKNIGYKCEYMYNNDTPMLIGNDAKIFIKLKNLNLEPKILQIIKKCNGEHYCINCEKDLDNLLLNSITDSKYGLCFNCYNISINNNCESECDFPTNLNYNQSAFYTISGISTKRISNTIKWFNNPNVGYVSKIDSAEINFHENELSENEIITYNYENFNVFKFYAIFVGSIY